MYKMGIGMSKNKITEESIVDKKVKVKGDIESVKPYNEEEHKWYKSALQYWSDATQYSWL